MSDPRRFASDPEQGLPAVVALPPGAVRAGPLAAAGTARRLWVALDDGVLLVPLPGPWRVEAVRDGLVAWSTTADARITPGGLDLNRDPRLRRGRDGTVRREPGGPWTPQGVLDGLHLPAGARWARDLRPWAEGRGLTWSDSGYAYAWDGERPPRPTGPATPWPPEPEPTPVLELPDDVERQPAKVAGLRVVAVRVEGDRVRGWLRDGTVLVDAR